MRTLFTLSLLLFGITTCVPQVLNATGVRVTVSAGSEVVVQGGAQLNAAASFLNDGTVRLLGDWTNNSAGPGFLALSTGNVLLHDPAAQVIQGTAVTDFRDLLISGGTKTLLQNATCGIAAQPDGLLTLNSGALVLNGRSFILYNAASSALTDAGGSIRSETADLQSRFSWALGSDITEHRIPFTNAANNALPFAFTPAAGFATNTLLTVATYPTALNNTLYPVTVNQQVLHMAGVSVADNSANSADRFWMVDLPNGSLTGTLHLSYAPPDDPFLGAGPVRAQRWIESAGTWQPPLPSQTQPFLREVVVPGVVFTDAVVPTNEHIWAMAYDNSPLPVELLQFAAVCEGNSVRLVWSTAIETNSGHFVVQRSADAQNWQDLDVVDAAGNSQQVIDYTYKDPSPLGNSTSYYRLLQVDVGGDENILPVDAVPACGQQGAIIIFPNPAHNVVWVDANALGLGAQNIDLLLVDAAGRTVATMRSVADQGRVALPLDHLAVGTYVLRLLGAQGQVLAVERIVKQ